MSEPITQYSYGWISNAVLVALSYAVGRWQASVAASRRITRVATSDEGRTGRIAATWRDADNRLVCTVVLDPRSLQPSVLVVCCARMASREWREGQEIIVVNGRVEAIEATEHSK